MKTPEYREGPEALENFERGMKALFKTPRPTLYSARSEAHKNSGKQYGMGGNR
jgi:hypothetical protein